MTDAEWFEGFRDGVSMEPLVEEGLRKIEGATNRPYTVNRWIGRCIMHSQSERPFLPPIYYSWCTSYMELAPVFDEVAPDYGQIALMMESAA